MIKFIIRRILVSIPLLWAVLTLTFLGFRVFIPGDPVDIMAFLAPAQFKAQLRHELGFDQPLITQYWNFMKGALHFDFGNSVYSQQSVAHEIAIRFPTTLKLAASAIVIALIVGFTGGILSALFNRNILGSSITTLAVFGFSVPEFVLGTLAILLFAVKL